MIPGIKNNSVSKHISLVSLLSLTLMLWQTSAPVGLSTEGWKLLIAFCTTILCIMSNVMPIGTIAFVSLVASIVTGILPLEAALSSFSSHILWLIICAFFISRSVIKTSLGTRIAYYLISKFGRTTLGLSYSLVLTELLLSPIIPSANARGGGVIFPILQSLVKNYEHDLEEVQASRKKKKNRFIDSHISEFLVMICFHANVITSGIFLTAMAANPMATKFAAGYNINIDWLLWAKVMVLPGVAVLLLMPIVIYSLCKPKVANNAAIVTAACNALRLMGNFKIEERIVSFVFLGLIIMWSLEKYLGIAPTTVAMIGCALLLLTGVLEWNDIISEKSAWDTFIWFGALMTLAGGLSKVGAMTWLSSIVHASVSSYPPGVAIGLLILFFFYVHYFFASITVHITMLYSTFLGVLLQFQVPPIPAAMTLAAFSSFSAGLTHYGTSSAPIFFGAGYISISKWWQISLIVSTFVLFSWLAVAVAWWCFLGLI